MPLNITIKQIERFFLSRKVAVFLLITTLVLLLLATRLEIIGTLTSSPFFVVLPVLIFTSILLCTLKRVRTRRAKAPDISAFNVKRDIDLEGQAGLSEAAAFIGRRWVVIEKDGGHILLGKGGVGFWGSVIFHMGLLSLLIAAMVTAITAFNAELLLNEGLPVPLGREGFLKIWREPTLPFEMPQGELVMEGFKARYEGDNFPVHYEAKLNVKTEEGEQIYGVGVNKPLNFGSLHYTLDHYGFSPGFVIKDGAGNLLFDGNVTLILMDGREDYFDVPDTNLRIFVRFYPDYVKTNLGGATTRSRIPNNPVFGLKVKRGEETGRGMIVKMGEEIGIDGLSISPTGLKYWAHFGVARDLGIPVFAVSFFLIVSGLLVRFIYSEKWLSVVCSGQRIEISGYSRYFPALFEGEVERIAYELSEIYRKKE